MSIHEWTSGSQTKEGNTSELSTDDILKSMSLEGKHERAALDRDDEDEPFGRGSSSGNAIETVMEYGKEYWYYALALVAVVILVVVMAGKFMGGASEAPTAEQTPSSDSKNQASADPSNGLRKPAGEVKDTGVEFAKPVVENGTYYLRSGEISWKGKAKATDSGEELTLEGPTAAQFKRSVALPHGEIMTGVFGRAQPDQPIVHGTFHRVTLGDKETTSGTYKAVDGNQILADGYYTDERDGDTIIRTYREVMPATGDQNSYRVSFIAPLDIPIPTLIGWEPPAVSNTQETG